MTKWCDLCHEYPAAVFGPYNALCRSCRRHVQQAEQDDNRIDNGPTCVRCGDLLNQSGVCPECVVRDVTEAHRALVRHG